MTLKFLTFCIHVQWNPDITVYQGTGKITLLYWGIIINSGITLLEKYNDITFIVILGLALEIFEDKS